MSHTYEKMPEETKQAPQQSPTTQQVPVSRPPVVCASPAGEAQGGLLDWFRGVFGGGQQGGQSAETPREQSQQWVENPNGQVNEDLVTMEPTSGNPLYPMLQPYPQEGVAQAPIFETHSILPTWHPDDESFGHMHSFVGLRFTQYDPSTDRYVRKRVKPGFGSNGLRNDNGFQADMSTETPISRSQLETVIDAIPRKADKKYNVVTYNCNHFTQQLADMVGAQVPAKLHDSVLGPIAARKRLANAAENGQDGRTRFFQGGGNNRGQMADSRVHDFLEHFTDAAKSAARWDGLPFLFHQSLSDAVTYAQEAIDNIKDYFPLSDQTLGGINPEQAGAAARLAKERAYQIIHLHLYKGHPRVTINAMKVVALADQLASAVGGGRSLSSFSDWELKNSFASSALENPKNLHITNETLFSGMQEADNLERRGLDASSLNGRSMNSAGDILLRAAGLSPETLILRHSKRGEAPKTVDNFNNCRDILREVSSTLNVTEDNKRFFLMFVQRRRQETPAQLGALAAQGILGCLRNTASNLRSPMDFTLAHLKVTTASIAKTRQEDSLEYTGETAQLERLRYINRQKDATGDLTADQAMRQALLDEMLTLETKLQAIFQDLTKPATTEQNNGEGAAGNAQNAQ
jgi:hypothetical protein